MTRIYISNIISDNIKTDGRIEITQLGIHELICDRRIESSRKTERKVVSILSPEEYESVKKRGYYIVNE